jgi:hypothetical protein
LNSNTRGSGEGNCEGFWYCTSRSTACHTQV